MRGCLCKALAAVLVEFPGPDTVGGTHTVKKLLFVVLAAVGAVIGARKLKAGQQEQALWAEATDNVTKS
jgi:hypothetical protein